MPYIKQEERQLYTELIFELTETLDMENANAGHLNYIFSRVINEHFANNGGNYQTANDIIGMLECVKQEFYRRQVAPYEDFKITENGDI